MGVLAHSGLYTKPLPSWGRCFWQDPNDGQLFLAFASGANAVNYTTSFDSGNNWTEPQHLFPVDDFNSYNNFDIVMDRRGHVHCLFRYNTSGCYQVMGKVPGGGWTETSGLGPCGFVNDIQESGSINGSLFVMEGYGNNDTSSDNVSKFPAARIAIKTSETGVDSFYIPDPFNVYPVEDFANFGPPRLRDAINTGPGSLGYPVWGQLSNGHPTLAITLESGYVDYYIKGTAGAEQWDRRISSKFNDTLVAYEVAPNFTMGIGSGQYNRMSPTIVASDSGITVWSSYNDLITGAVESYFRVNEETITRSISDLNLVGGHTTNGIFPLATGQMASGYTIFTDDLGTSVDFSITNEPGQVVFYVQDINNKTGLQTVKRILATQIPSYNDGSQIYDAYEFQPVTHPISGIKHVIDMDSQWVGGDGSAHIDKIKACKHPTTAQDVKYDKGEFLVTKSLTSTYPSGGAIVFHNVGQSVEVAHNVTHPYFNMELTSGNLTHNIMADNGIFEQFDFTNVDRLFNIDIGSASSKRVTCSSGSWVTIELDRASIIDRVEFYASNTFGTPGDIWVGASNDGVNFGPGPESGSYVNGLFNTGSATERLLRATSATGTDTQYPHDANSETNVVPFLPICGKYIRFTFGKPAIFSNQLVEIKLFGPGATRKINTDGQMGSSTPPLYEILPHSNSIVNSAERFVGKQGTLPSQWSSTGNFFWSIDASGDLAKSSVLPSIFQNTDGTIESGVFAGFPNGSGDGFSLKVSPGVSYGEGVALTTINIDESEGIRPIAFDYQYDVSIGDKFQFYTIDNSVGGTGVLRLEVEGDVYGSADRWETFELDALGEGEYTLKWVYQRKGGNTGFRLNEAWIDNFVGGDTTIFQPSIYGYVKGPELQAATGAIHGYSPSPIFHKQIHGWLNAVAQTGAIHGFVLADANALSSIYGYLDVAPVSQINAFLLGSSGDFPTRSIPTGSIHGYVGGAFGSGPSHIHGYLEGDWGRTIYGYVHTSQLLSELLPSGENELKIHGFVPANYPFSSIPALVNAGATGVSGVIHGYIKGSGLDQLIHGYVSVPSGSGPQYIHGWTEGWDGGINGLGNNQSAIYGYINGETITSGNIYGYMLANFPVSNIYGYLGTEALVASGGGSVGGGPGGVGSSTSNVTPGMNWVHGYLKASGSEQIIHGYLSVPSGSTSIRHGLVSAGDIAPNEIHGFSLGHDTASTGIHGYASGIGYENFTTHGWTFGSSGLVSSDVHGYMIGVMIPNSSIPSLLVASDTGNNSISACPSHNYPLPALLTVTIPTGNFF